MGRIDMFPELEEFIEENDLSVNSVKKSITTHLQALLEHFNKYFPEEAAPEKYDWIRSPFSADLTEMVEPEALSQEACEKCGQEIAAEFTRLVAADLPKSFLSGLDRHLPRLLELYKARERGDTTIHSLLESLVSEYSILDVAVARPALYARGLQVLWRCFQLLARQLRLRHAAEQKVAILKGEVALWKRKADEALQRLEVLQATTSFAQDDRTDAGSQMEKEEEEMVFFGTKCVQLIGFI
ncbi:hypothetical protein KUCAC02_001564 [Chaenocephalus aceratus]|uniref:Uncharacterized protein n=1 Tax=Chaenocephalus aceratus TaxID=36190 RepID=A0ACB9XTA3_CHAAC|nr:hypothetical protein KUCAC02_001564 [Chaenocephalus aceratus]